MPSVSLQMWTSTHCSALDELETAHQGIGGRGRGRRYATLQVNHAYTVLLSSQFQGFCRDLHRECCDHLAQTVLDRQLRPVFFDALVRQRRLDRGNPNPGNIGDDFNRICPRFWDLVRQLDLRNQTRQARLEELNRWRNAIAHQDFDPQALGSTTLRLRQVRDWRSACDQLTIAFDEVMRNHLHVLLRRWPWPR